MFWASLCSHSSLLFNWLSQTKKGKKKQPKTSSENYLLSSLWNSFLKGEKVLLAEKCFIWLEKGSLILFRGVQQRTYWEETLKSNPTKVFSVVQQCSGTTNTKMWPLVFWFVYLTPTEYLSVVKNRSRDISTLLSKLFSYCTMWLTSSLIILHLSPSKHGLKFCKWLGVFFPIVRII